MSQRLRNYAEAAEWLSVPRRWLEDQVRAGLAPHTRLGKHVRFSQAHLDAIVAAGEPESAAIVAPDAFTSMNTRGRRSQAQTA